MGKVYDIVIIGGGAAGLYAAATLSSLNMEGASLKVLLLEKMHRCGLKIGITGKGRCNLTNTKPWEEFSSHIHPKNIFLKNSFYGMSNLSTMEFFEKIGLPLVVERGDRVFPQSMKATDVPSALEKHILRGGVEIKKNAPVRQVKSSPDNLFLVEYGEGEELASKKIIVATGGLSYKTTGSTGDGYEFARCFGHKITQCFPSLTALRPKDYREEFQGISLKNVSLQLVVNGNVVQEEFGDLDFTNGGIEGPIGFKVSRKGVHSIINGQKVEVVLDMKPAVSHKQLKERISRELLQVNGNQLKGLLPKLLPQSIVPMFVAAHKNLSIENLPEKLKCWKFAVEGYVGYERCVVTAGGVHLQEVSQKSMESKLVKGLYFAGEVLDLDGDTGGYNLQIAFSTGALAAMSAAKSTR